MMMILCYMRERGKSQETTPNRLIPIIRDPAQKVDVFLLCASANTTRFHSFSIHMRTEETYKTLFIQWWKGSIYISICRV
jgi:hypothetical protein